MQKKKFFFIINENLGLKRLTFRGTRPGCGHPPEERPKNRKQTQQTNTVRI